MVKREPPPEQVPLVRLGRFQPRFGLRALLLAMLIASMMATALSYFFQALRGRSSMRLVFVLFSVAGPLLLLVVISALWGIVRLFQRRD